MFARCPIWFAGLLGGSEDQLEAELHDAGVAGGVDGAELGAGVAAVGAGAKGVVDEAPVDLVEGVESFGAELEVEALEEAGVLDERQVEVDGAGVADVGDGAADVAELEGGRVDELIGVEPAVLVAFAIGKLRADAGGVGKIRGLIVRATDGERDAGRHDGDPVDLPAADDLAREGAVGIPGFARRKQVSNFAIAMRLSNVNRTA